MLRLFTILLLFAVAVFATSQNVWKGGKEYNYEVRSRTLTAVNLQAKQYSGILMKARLTIQPNEQGILRAKIFQPLYSRIHTHLENGWESDISEDKLSMINLPLSEKTFEVKTKNGLVQDLQVDEDVTTWEVNILKSIVSQLQVDARGENAIKSKHNQLPNGEHPFAVFRTMEDSVGGKCEVLYNISPVLQQKLADKPELLSIPALHEEKNFISLVKTKNFSHCHQRVSYHFGVNGRNGFEPGDNDNGRYLSRSSASQIIISGNLRRYTIRSSVTNNKIVLNPDQNEKQQGMVASKINLTLVEVKDVSDTLPAPSKPQSVGNLVYNYNNPFASSSTRRPNKVNQNEDENSDESKSTYNSSENKKSNNDDSYLQVKPTLTEAPRNPMLPYFIGNNGKSIWDDQRIDVIESVKNIARQIGNDMEKADSMQNEDTLEKFTILTRIIRTMNAQQIDEAQRELYESPPSLNQVNQNNQDQSNRRNTWIAFRDAVANAGTGPALVNIKQWIQNKKIQNVEAAIVVDALAKSTQIPSSDFMDAFFDLVTMSETKEQPLLRDTAVLSFADLSRHAIVNKRSAHNRYPVHAFSRISSKNNKHFHEKYIPYMVKELEAAIISGDSKKVQIYTVALGKTGHPRILSVFEPYIEGRKHVSPFQRLIMVMSLEKLASLHPKVARLVLYNIYSNKADHYEIRCAAVFMLMKTKPPASMLQRMAESTNSDSSKHVNSAVKSSIESLAQLENNEARDISNAAKTALPLLTSETYGIQYSRAFLKNVKDPKTHSGFSLEAKLIGSDDSIIPRGVFVTIQLVCNGLKLPTIHLGGVVSTIQNLWDFVEDKLGLNEKNNNVEQKAEKKMYSPQNIAKKLGIRGDDPKQIEGFVLINEKNLGDYFISFDNHTLGLLPQKFKELDEVMKRGINFGMTKFSNYEVTISFPTETGYPLTFTFKTPTIMGVSGSADVKTEYDSENRSPIPSSALVNGKVKLVYGLKVQKRLGFVTPFEHQEYIAGVDRNILFYFPLHSKIDYDTNKQKIKVTLLAHDKLQADEEKNAIEIIQVETKPFTSNHDIGSLRPVSSDTNTHIINKDYTSSSQIEIKDENNKQRAQFKWETQSDQLIKNKKFNRNQNPVKAVVRLVQSIVSLSTHNDPEKTEYEKYSIKLTPSNDMSVDLRVSYDMWRSKNNNTDEDNKESLNAKAPDLEKSLNETEHQQKLHEDVTKNINSAQAAIVDLCVEVNGVMRSSATLTAAIAVSEVDQKSRVLAFSFLKTMSGQQYHMGVGLETKNPYIQSLDYEETLKANNGSEFDADIHYGKGSSDNDSEKEDYRIKIKGNIRLTEERKNEIRQSSDAQACSKHKRENGNIMTSVCQKVNENAASGNAGYLIVSSEDEALLKDILMNSLDDSVERSQILVQIQKDIKEAKEKNNIKVDFELSDNGNKADVSINAYEGNFNISDINLSIFDDELGDNENLEDCNIFTTRCSIDKSEIRTFDDQRSIITMGQCWYVAMTSYLKNDPDRPNHQQNIPENMQTSVLVKENKNGEKELKITLGDNEIELLTSESSQPQAKVNGESVELSKKMSHVIEDTEEVVIELFELPDDSIKLVSYKYNLDLIYDGSRAQIEAGERYRNSVRGLCGNNDGEPENDKQIPDGCILQKPEEFSATWAFTEDETCKGPVLQNAVKARDSQCIRKSIRPGNYINDEKASRESQ